MQALEAKKEPEISSRCWIDSRRKCDESCVAYYDQWLKCIFLAKIINIEEDLDSIRSILEDLLEKLTETKKP